jgi:hypothetical protein
MVPLVMSADELARDPGAPIGPDEIDPDLIRLPRGLPTLGALASAAIVIMCVVLMVRLRHDLAFARASSSARQVTVDAIVAGNIAADSYVTVDAPPDHVGAIRIRTSEATAGSRVVAVRGASDHLWLALSGDGWDHFTHDDRVTGRLRRLAAARFAGPLSAALRSYPAPRFVTGAELKRAKTSGDTHLTLYDGAAIIVTSADEVELSLADPGAAVVVAALSPSRSTVEAWTDALAAAGVIAATDVPASESTDLVRWNVRRPDAVTSIQAALDGAQLWGARVEPANARVRTAWSQVITSDVGIVGPNGVIPWAAVDVAGIWAPRTIPADAWVILTGEAPGDYWYLQLIYIGLAVIGGLFVWALVRSVRRQFFDRQLATAH